MKSLKEISLKPKLMLNKGAIKNGHLRDTGIKGRMKTNKVKNPIHEIKMMSNTDSPTNLG